ncbi:xanthine dehydrogenase accessory protein XdhC [Bdellovibrionota bacterium FG-2]
MWDWISKLSQLRQQGTPAVLVTVSQVSGSAPREIGAKMIVLESGKFFGTIGGGRLEELALQDAQKTFQAGKAQSIRYPLGAKTGQCCGGVVELLMEVMNTGPLLYIFGAGHVGQAVCRTFVGTPFQIHVIDEREEWVNSDQIPPEVIRHHCPSGEWDDFVKEAIWDDQRVYVAILTHRHDLDQEICSNLLNHPRRFLGMIGSSSKWSRIQERLLQKGAKQSDLNQVRCPMGLSIGGKAPQEIAISLAAEVLSIHYGTNHKH